jgi:hypothetical protein
MQDDRPRERSTDKRAVRVYLDHDLYDELKRRADRAREKPSSPASRVLALWLTGQLVDIDCPQPAAASGSQSQPLVEECSDLAAGSPHVSMYPCIHSPIDPPVQAPPTAAEPAPEPRKQRTTGALTKDELVWFDRFWSLVPKKASKGGAKRAWRGAVVRAGGVEPILTGMEAYATKVRTAGTEASKIKHPSGWLRDDRWEDEPEPDFEAPDVLYGNPAPSEAEVEDFRRAKARAEAEGPDPEFEALLAAKLGKIGRRA